MAALLLEMESLPALPLIETAAPLFEMVSSPACASIIKFMALLEMKLLLSVPSISKGFSFTPTRFNAGKFAAPESVIFPSPTVMIISFSRVALE